MKTEFEFHRQFCSGGRSYFLGKDIYTRYREIDKIKKLIKENIRQYILIDAAVRITLDTPDVEGERLIISTPFLADSDVIISNIVDLLYTNLQSYYISANNKLVHYGISNIVMEGFDSSALRRELELVCNSISRRQDIAGRALIKVNFENIQHIMRKKFLFSSALTDKLDIHLGYRIVLYGNNINSQNFFIPIMNDNGVLQQIYNNLETILHHNFVTYDENAQQGYLRLSNNLIMKEMVSLLRRAKDKENIRKKIIHGIKFSTVLTNDPLKRYGELAGDYVYDTINQVDNKSLMEASDRSRALYDTFNFRVAWDTERAANYKYIDGYDDAMVFRNGADHTPHLAKEDSPFAKTSASTDNSTESKNEEFIDDIALNDDSDFEEI